MENELETEKWVRHLIHLMERMDRKMDENRREANGEIRGLRTDVTQIRESLAALKVKAGLWGLVGGNAFAVVKHLIGK